MSRATVELDLFGIERQNAPEFLPPRPSNSTRGIQNGFFRMNPDLLYSAMASGVRNRKTNVVPPEKGVSRDNARPTLPVLNPFSRSYSESPKETVTQITIFYNGAVTVFNLPPERAEAIMKLAEAGANGGAIERIFPFFSGDFPLARKRSLLHFFEKRKERLNMQVPYKASSLYPYGFSGAGSSKGEPTVAEWGGA